MKGFSHFMSGLAAATFFREVVQAGDASSFAIVLGGIFGILPDTLDFKFVQFFEKYHTVIDPDPNNPDAQKIAEQIAETINKAYETGKNQALHLLTIQKGSDLWRQYRVFFDISSQEVQVSMGPIVNTSKKPFPGTEIQGASNKGVAKVNAKFSPKIYDKETFVDIMSGPSFEFVPEKDGSIRVDFLPWHRRWSHSLVLGAFLGLLGGIILNPICGLIIAIGFCVHIIEDQGGYMGNNLFWPFTHHKTHGTEWMHSGDAWPNFSAVWLSVALILYNLNRFRPDPVFTTFFPTYILYTYLAPIGVIWLLGKSLDIWEKKTRIKIQKSSEEERREEAIKEMEEEVA